MTELSIDFPEFKVFHLLKPTSAKIKQNHEVIWKGPVQFNGSIAKLDLKTIKGCEKHTLFTIEFYNYIKGRLKKSNVLEKIFNQSESSNLEFDSFFYALVWYLERT